MTWLTWPSLATFNAWHDGMIQHLALPRVGVNAGTGVPAVGKQMTLAYTSVVRVGPTDYRAVVNVLDVPQHLVALLGVECDAPPEEGIDP